MRVVRYSFLTLCGLLLWGYLVGPAPQRPVEIAAAEPRASAAPEVMSDEPEASQAAFRPTEPVPLPPPEAAPDAIEASVAPLELTPAETDAAVAAALDGVPLATAEVPLAEEPLRPAEPVTISEPAGVEQLTAIVSVDKLNLRSGPGTSFEALSSLTYGMELAVQGDEVDGWVRVAFDGFEGYVAAEYVEIVAAPG